jgi:hypothetical protein
MAESIVFPEGHQTWDVDRTSLSFRAVHGNQEIRCVLPFVTLMDSYTTDPDYDRLNQQISTERIYARHRDQIHDTCRQMIEGGFVRDGELVINSL